MAPLVPEDARREIKFVTRRSHYEQIKDWLHHNQALFRISYPPRAVNNIYFDTYNYDAYGANLSGGSARTKVRYRWYGKYPQPRSGKLEIKHKRNMFGWKTLFPIADPPWKEGITWTQLKAMISKNLPLAGKLWLQHHPLPVIINRYEREYFLSSDGLVRATIDTDQIVLDQRRKLLPNLSVAIVQPDDIIVEIKCHRSERERASEIIQGIPIRASAYSKYVNGVHAVSGNTPR